MSQSPTQPVDLHALGVLKPSEGGSGGGGGGGGGGGAAGDMSSNSGDPKRVVHNTVTALTGGALPLNVGSFLENGGIQQGLERGAVTDQMIVQFSAMRGGFVASLAAAVLSYKNLFSGTSAPEIASIPIEALGQLHPLHTPGTGQSQSEGMSMA